MRTRCRSTGFAANAMGCNVLVLAVALSAGGCLSHPERGESAVVSVGTAVLPLEAVSASGKIYRLLGEFVISGASTLRISTMDHAGGAVTQQLAVGDYSVFLAPGWALEKQELEGSSSTSNATLISVNPQSFTIRDGDVTRVTFRFEVDGELVSAKGDLEIVIDVEERLAAGGSGGIGGATSGGTAGTNLHHEVFWAYPPSVTPQVKLVETIMSLRGDPNTLLVATQTEGADCGTGPGAAIGRVTLDPTTGTPTAVTHVQQLQGTQSVRGQMIEGGTDGTLLTGSGWCGSTPPYYSTNHGQSWSIAVSGGAYPSNSVFAYAEFNGSIYAGTGYRPNAGEVYRWTGNATWQRVYSFGTARNIVQGLATYDGKLFAGGTLYETCGACAGTTAVVVSSDGQTFTPTEGIPECHHVLKLFNMVGTFHALTALCGSEERFLYSWDPVTAKWSALRSIGDLRADPLRFAVSKGVMFTKSTDLRTIMVSRDMGEKWEPVPDLGTTLSGEIWSIMNVNDTIYWTAFKGSDGRARIFRIAP